MFDRVKIFDMIMRFTKKESKLVKALNKISKHLDEGDVFFVLESYIADKSKEFKIHIVEVKLEVQDGQEYILGYYKKQDNYKKLSRKMIPIEVILNGELEYTNGRKYIQVIKSVNKPS